MTPELKFLITAQNRSSAVLKQVGGDIATLKAQAASGGQGFARFGNDVAKSASLSRTQMLMLGHEARATFEIIASGGGAFRALTLEAPRLIDALSMSEGGIGGGLKAVAGAAAGLAPAFLAIGAATGVAAGGVAGLTYEINKSAAVHVSFFDVVKGGWNLLTSTVAAGAKNAVAAIAGPFDKLVDYIAPGVKAAGNAIVGGFVFTYNYIVGWWKQLPAAIGEIVIDAANATFAAETDLINKGVDLLDQFIASANSKLSALGVNIGALGHVTPIQIGNPFQGTASNFSAQVAQMQAAAGSVDYMGKLFDAWSAAAQQAALADDKATKGLKPLDLGIRGLKTSAQNLADTIWGGVQSAFSSVFGTLKDDLQQGMSAFDAARDTASKFFDTIANKALELAGNGVFNILASAFGLGGGVGSGFGGLGSLFNFGGGGSVAPTSLLGAAMYAQGTDFHPGGLAIVGEDGPELLNLPRGSQVVPNSQMGSVGGVVVNVSIDARGATSGVGDEIAKKLRQMLPQAIVDARRRGALA